MSNIKQNFCPACGKNINIEDTIGGVCADCFIKNADLIQYPENDEILICKKCGTFYDAEWKYSIDEEDAVIRYISSRIKTAGELEENNIDLTPERMDSNRIRVNGILNGKIKGRRVKKTFDCIVHIRYGVCDSCSRISGGYYESILQIRSDKQGLNDDEQDDIKKIVIDYVNRRYDDGDKRSFITKIEDLNEGIDFYLGSKAVSKQVCKMIKLKYGGNIQRSSKLVGVKDGKNLYRVTYSLRLFKIVPGDVISFNDHFMHVIKVAKKIEGRDLKSGETVLIDGNKNDIDHIRMFGNIKKGINTVLVSIGKEKIEVIDPYTQKKVKIFKPYFIDKIKDNRVCVIKTKDGGLLAVPPKYYNISIKK